MDNSPETSASAGRLLATLTTSVISEPTASLPPASYGLLSLLLQDDGGKDGSGGDHGIQKWSSFIGIVTAICGNILISFALNIQRYAHVRIEREAEGERVRMGSRRHVSASTYGSVNTPYRGDEEDRPRSPIGSLEQGEQGARAHPEDGAGFYRDERENDQMQQSRLSDRTVKPNDSGSSQKDRANYLRSPYWWAGIVLMSLGEMGNFLAYGFAPASIVSPLGVVALISNCVIAPFLLKEKFRKRDFWGVVIAIAGAVVVVLSAKTSETKIGPRDIWIMITQWEFELYLGLTALLIVTLMSLSHKYGGRTILIDLGLVGLFGTFPRRITPLLMLTVQTGGYTALSTKGVASLLSFTLWHVITFPVTYLLVAVLVFSALMQIRYINRALQRFDSTQVIPTQFVLFTLCVITGSAVLYRDFESTTASQALKFVGGCGLTFLGVYFITSGRVNDDEYSEDEDEEESAGLLHSERYRDRMHSSQDHNQRTQKPGQSVGEHQNQPRSPRASLLSEDLEADDRLTPTGLLSPAVSDRDGSISDDSLSEDFSSSPQRQPLTENPWASPERTPKASVSDPAVHQAVPATPPSRPSHVPQTPPVLFRFPAAPTSEAATSSPNRDTQEEQSRSLQPPVEIRTPEQRRRNTAHTPQSSARNSLSLRLTPGPLLSPFSSTLSTVVADSLRRGEGSPRRHHRSKSGRIGTKGSTSLRTGTSFRDDDDAEYEAEANVDDGRAISSSAVTSTPGSSRYNSSANIPKAQNVAALIINRKDADGGETTTRLRSLSDSLGGRLGWLGSTFRPSRKSAQATPPHGEGQDSQEEDAPL